MFGNAFSLNSKGISADLLHLVCIKMSTTGAKRCFFFFIHLALMWFHYQLSIYLLCAL